MPALFAGWSFDPENRDAGRVGFLELAPPNEEDAPVRCLRRSVAGLASGRG